MIRTFSCRNIIQSSTILLIIGATFMSTSVQSQQQPGRQNKIVGTWVPASVQAEIGGKTVDLYGAAPAGSLIFTENMRFSVIVHDPRLFRFASDNRARATQSETLAAASGSLALYGTTPWAK
jgi:Lipocalin-like domain